MWAFVASLGGGLVTGDRIALSVEVGADARLFLGTQASTKVYRSRAGVPARQELQARVGPGGLLASIPDPVSCFAQARLVQRQTFRLQEDASLVAVDALVGGRRARGERWAFAAYDSRLEVWRGERLLLADALLLGGLPGLPLEARMAPLDALALVVAVGPLAAGVAETLVAAAAAARADGVLASVAAVDGGVVARFGAEDRGRLSALLARALAPLAPALGGDPLQRKW